MHVVVISKPFLFCFYDENWPRYEFLKFWENLYIITEFHLKLNLKRRHFDCVQDFVGRLSWFSTSNHDLKLFLFCLYDEIWLKYEWLNWSVALSATVVNNFNEVAEAPCSIASAIQTPWNRWRSVSYSALGHNELVHTNSFN